MKLRWSGAVLGVGLLVGLFGGPGTAVAASPWGGAPPAWGPWGHAPAPVWRPVAFAPQRPAWTVPVRYGLPEHRWRPLADARAVAVQRLAAAGRGPVTWSPRAAAPPPLMPGWGIGPPGRMTPPVLAAGRPAAPRYADHPPGAWRGAGHPLVVTVGGQPYRFRPLPLPARQVAAVAPPQWGRGAMPVRPPVAWAPVPAGARYVQPAMRPAPDRAGWLVYRFRPDTRFPHGETLQVPAGARLSHAAAGPDWQTGEPAPQAGHAWRSGYVYN